MKGGGLSATSAWLTQSQKTEAEGVFQLHQLVTQSQKTEADEESKSKIFFVMQKFHFAPRFAVLEEYCLFNLLCGHAFLQVTQPQHSTQ